MKDVSKNATNVLVGENKDGIILSELRYSLPPPDGHCLLHSVVSSLRLQMNPSVKITNAMLLECLRKQVYEFRSQYKGFIKHHMPITGFHRYAVHRHYESEFGDLAPQIISNALNIQLIILSEAAGSFTIMKASPCYNPDALPLFLHKHGKHYNGISPKLSKSY